jgi:hypothetical protein
MYIHKLLFYIFFCNVQAESTPSANMSVMAGAKIQEEMNNIPLADDDPQGKLFIFQL